MSAGDDPVRPTATAAGAPSSKTLEHVVEEAKRRSVPTKEARDRLQGATKRLLAKAAKVASKRVLDGHHGFEPVLVGSAAKDTWLPGHVDLDVFLLFDPKLPRETLEKEGLGAGRMILEEAELRYAEHPYVVGPFEGYQADVVPAYKVRSGEEIQSSVDRTPFHNEWVKEKIRKNPDLSTEIRVMKAWLRGVEVYGAKTATRGVSGYLAEVLTIHHGGFVPALMAIQDFQPGSRVDPTGKGTAPGRDEALVVIDPVDPTRNAAAAVREDRLNRLQQAAEAFLRSPNLRFFEPAPLVPPRLSTARNALGRRGFVLVTFPAPQMREDDQGPHIERAAFTLARHLERAGFDIERSWGGVTADGRSVLTVTMKTARLPRTRLHMGPPVGIQARAQEFRAKYTDHPDVVDEPFEMEHKGKRHVAVRLRERKRDLAEQTGLVIRRVSFGKHADQAIEKGPLRVLSLEEALWDPVLAKVVAAQLTPLPPWRRTGHPHNDYQVDAAD